MKIYLADTFIDGVSDYPQKNVEIYVDGGVIQEIVPTGQKERQADWPVYCLPGRTVMPGFIDAHVHLMFGDGPRSYEDVVFGDTEGLALLRAARNAYQHLRAGVTMLRDSGASNNIGFSIKEGANAGLFLSPRIHVCGRPITMTGGHFYWCNEETDGVDGVRRSSRKLLKQGADFLKIMASGGGGTRNSDMTRPSFTVAEMAVAVEEAHQVGKKTAAHCLAAEGIERAVDAGIDEIDHINFLRPDGTRVFDDAVAEKMVRQGTYVCPTIPTGYRRIEELQNKGNALSIKERKQLDENLYKLETKLSFVKRLYDMGVPIVAGTDATPIFGDYAICLQLCHRAGMPVMDVIRSATSIAAKSVGMEDKIGTLKPGMLADFIYLDNPLEDVSAFDRVQTVVLNGDVVVDKVREAQSARQFGMLHAH